MYDVWQTTLKLSFFIIFRPAELMFNSADKKLTIFFIEI